MTRQQPRSPGSAPDARDDDAPHDEIHGDDRPDDTRPGRYTGGLARGIEQRWQSRWEEQGTFHAANPVGPLAQADGVADLPKIYVLDMFPYPSGSGLHVGHPLGFIGTDVYSRFKRMTGHNVMYTMGFDAFGLPAEQYAVQTGQHPAITTEENISTYRRQLRRLGLSHDDRRSVSTADPSYYRWTQWIFLQVFGSWYDRDRATARPISELIAEFDDGTRHVDGPTPWTDLDEAGRRRVIDGHRLAYISEAPVNWCPGLGTVVANEEVTSDGRSDRGNFPVFKRSMRQWMMRITDYADRLIDDLDLLDWTDAIKAMQRNWIGRSVGATVRFATVTNVNTGTGTGTGDGDGDGDGAPISVFTTRPDTLFGATFLVLAPEHPLVDALTTAAQRPAVDAYRAAAAAKDDIARQSEGREKSGVDTGSTAVNPVTGEHVPVWIADYVLMGYGTGAIMAVPCGDQRDFEFARSFQLAIVAIQRPSHEWLAGTANAATPVTDALDTAAWPAAFVGEAPYVNSTRPGLDLTTAHDVADAKRMTIEWLGNAGAGEATVTYKLRDWLFSRQRYWGEPFPIVYDDQDLPYAVPDDQLPLVLPDTDSFSPKTFDPDDALSDPQSPLARLDRWVDVELDLGDGPRRYRRDTNVMPQWAGSCWYELRYLDPTNDTRFVDAAVEQYWMGPQGDRHPGGVDLYVGGVEHAVLHLLYSRFWHKVLYDLGHVSSREPFYRLYNQGYILAEAFLDERGIYVDAAAVQHDGEAFTYDGRPVTREWGKMGKSLKNAVAPDEIYDAYGADTLRLHEMAMGPLDASRPWETRDVVGMYRFLQRLWRNIVDETTGELRVLDAPPDAELLRLLHRTIAGVRDDMEGLRFNTAIAKLIELNNALTKLGGCPTALSGPLVLMVAPLAPHIAEELWHMLGHTTSLAREPFPVADPALLVAETVEYPVQINGKVRARVVLPANASAAEVEPVALADAKVVAALAGATPKKVIVVPGRMVNIVV